MEDIFGKVKTLIVDRLGVEADAVVSGATFLDDLGADSLDVVELIMAIEEEFDIEVPDEEAEKISSVGDAVAYIQKKLDSKDK